MVQFISGYMHYEMEVEEHDVFPDDPEFDIGKAPSSPKNPYMHPL